MSQAPDRTSKPPTIRTYPPRVLVAATALLILFLVAITSAMLYVSYQETLRQQATTLRNLSIAFSAQTASVAQALDNVMLQAESAYAAQGTTPDAPLSLANFGARSLAREYLLGIYLYDASGKLVASDRPAWARATPPPPELLRKALDSKADGLRIGISHIDPDSGRGVINFSRPTVDDAGRRTGIVLAQADSERFERIYSLVELGKGGSVTLFNRDGSMLVRGPNYPAGIGNSFAHTPLFQTYLPASERGAIAAASPLDGEARLYGYDAVAGYPLVIITGLNREDALLAWRERMWSGVVSLGLFGLTVIFLAWRVARDAARQASLIGQLALSETRAEKSAEYLEAILNAVRTPIWVLDRSRKIVMLNKAFSRFVGRPAQELVGQPESAALDPGSAAEREGRYHQVLVGEQDSEALGEMADGNGAPRTVIQLTSKLLDEAGQAQLVSVLTDVTERQKVERRLAYVANFDLLTGLPNQGQFRRMLEAEVAGARVQGACVGVLMVSLERIQEISVGSPGTELEFAL